MKASEVDKVVFIGERFSFADIACRKYTTFSVEDQIREQKEYWYPRLYEGKQPSYLDVFADKIYEDQFPGGWDEMIRFFKKHDRDNSSYTEELKDYFKNFRCQAIEKHLGISADKVVFAHHTLSHAYYAYYAATIDKSKKTLVLTAEAWGDDMNASVNVAQGDRFETLSTSDNYLGGRLYRYMTLLLGMKPDEHEYKVMGLAAYCRPEYYQKPLEIFRNTMQVDGIKFTYKDKPKDLYFWFRERLEGIRFDAIAGALQQYTQEILLEWTKNSLKETGANQIVFGGGVGMNIRGMMEIGKLPEVEDVFVSPTPSDESLAIGGCYLKMHEACKESGRNVIEVNQPLENSYLGVSVTPQDLKDTYAKAAADGHKVVRTPELAIVAQLLTDNKIIGRCVGRSEFGARALGNRSILAHPSRRELVRVINDKIKCRDFWMPFAPTILDESADEYLVNPKGFRAPYMSVGFETTDLGKIHLNAALHQSDQTVRPQIITREANPDYYDLISEFKKMTGVGALLNTSFNLHGWPIVQTAEEAYQVFCKSDLDALLLDDGLVVRAVPRSA